MHEGLTLLCIPKPLQMKTQAAQRLTALDACTSMSCLQHISFSLEALVLSKHNQRALTWPGLYEAAGSSTHSVLQFSSREHGTSSQTPQLPFLVLVPSL